MQAYGFVALRVVELARKLCPRADWSCTSAMCELVPPESGGSKCSRCGLAVRPQPEGQCSYAACPAPQVARDDLPWPAGEASLRSVLGRVKGYRRWCCLREADTQPQSSVQLPRAVPLVVVQRERTEAGLGAKMARVGPQWAPTCLVGSRIMLGHWIMHLSDV